MDATRTLRGSGRINTLKSPRSRTHHFSSVNDRSATLAGIGLMLLATLMFSLNDVLGKWLVATYSVGQILLVRSIASLAMLAPFLLRSGFEQFRRAPRPWLQILRMVLSTFEVACFYAA